ncbi:MAG: dTDP-4-dehydrorhamnose reductase [Planctomycetota bacterium]
MLVTGAAGMLGSVVLLRAPAGVVTLATSRGGTLPEVCGDVPLLGGVVLAERADVESLGRWFGELDAVVHCAAFTDVDGAESDPSAAQRGGVLATEEAARLAARTGAALLLVSTDFVFDGEAREPYAEDAPTHPLSVYGRTKLEAEHRAEALHPGGVAVVRAQWLYGARGRHFPGTMLRLARAGTPLRVVADQVGSPTSTAALVPALWDLLAAGGRGVFHAACEGRASWYEFARETLRLAGVDAELAPCSTAEFPRPARRPAFSVLNCARLADLRGRTLPPWQEALAAFLATSSTCA